jgi:hypothetical protein
VRRKLGFDPDPKQALVLTSASKRGMLNCARQWGKSTITAAKAVYEAVHGKESLILVVSPSARQSGEFVRKAEGFARRLGMRAKGDGTNEMSLQFPNRSRIIGLPGERGDDPGIFGGIAAAGGRSVAGTGRSVHGGAADAGGKFGGAVADEHAARQAGFFL